MRRSAALLAALLLSVLPRHADAASPVTALAFGPDGRTLAQASARTILLRDLAGTNPPVVRKVDLPKCTSLAFSPVDRRLAVAGGTPGVSGAALLLDLASLEEMARLDAGPDLASAVAFDATGRHLAVAGARTVRVHDVSSESPVFRHELAGHVGAVLGIAFSPDGRLLVSAGRDRSVKVWSMTDGRLLRSFSHHTESVHAVAVRPSPARGDAGTGARAPFQCATAGDDRTVRIWQPGIGRMVRIVRGHEDGILALAYAPDGRVLFTAGSEGLVRRVDADSDSIQHAWRASDDWIHALAASPDGRQVATGDWRGTVSIWNAAGSLERRFEAEPTTVGR